MFAREVFNTIAKEDSEFMDEQDSDFEVILFFLNLGNKALQGLVPTQTKLYTLNDEKIKPMRWMIV